MDSHIEVVGEDETIVHLADFRLPESRNDFRFGPIESRTEVYSQDDEGVVCISGV